VASDAERKAIMRVESEAPSGVHRKNPESRVKDLVPDANNIFFYYTVNNSFTHHPLTLAAFLTDSHIHSQA